MTTNQKYACSLSIVMPVFNEQDVISEVVRDFAAVLDRFETPEFVIVNDCSTDSTLSILESLRKEYPYLRVITPPENRGHGPSLARAYRESTGQYVFHCDSDKQFLASDFWLLWEKMASDHLDVAIGNRASRYDPMARLVLTRIVRLFLLSFFGVATRDSNCPFKLHTRAALDRILPLLPENPLVPSILMTVAAHKLKLKMSSVDVKHLPRLTGRSFIRSWKIFKITTTAAQEVFRFKKALSGLNTKKNRKENEQHVTT